MDPPPPYPGPSPARHFSPLGGADTFPPQSGHVADFPWLHPHAPGRLRLQTSMPDLRTNQLASSPGGRTPSSTTSYQMAPVGLPAPVSVPSTTTPTSTETEKSFWQTALSETRNFAGGLIPHPTESTKHYTILRHSSALVFYRGPSTSVEISIFSSPSHPLPPDRTLWLQQRGFSGDSGMKLKALVGATGDWLHVTPAVQSRPEELASGDERAWMRDIARVAKKSLKENGERKAHIPRETHVVRIPAVSTDGYFRLVLCTGDASKRKVLCQSPIFRVASTSTDSSVFRGASLSTMPIEVGVKVASVVASNTVQRYTGPIVGIVQGRIDKLKPGLVAREAGKFAMGELRRDAKPGDARCYTETMHGGPLFQDENLRPIGPDSGPESPFPLKFSGKVIPGTGRSRIELGIPTANLDGLSPDDVNHRLRGVYFGWASLVPTDNSSPVWHQSIISVGPSPYARPSIVAENNITVHLFNEFPISLIGAKMRVMTMGFIRPTLDPTALLPQRLDMVSRDVLLTVASLAREHWGPEATVQRLRGVKSARNLSERFDETRDTVQRRVESVPLHVVGVRTAEQEAREGGLGRGGYWVRR